MGFNQDFTATMLQMSREYGLPLTHENDPFRHQSYVDLAAENGNDLPIDSVLGKVAKTTTELATGDLYIELSMLNESFGMMPDYGHGSICGSVAVTLTQLQLGKNLVVSARQALGFDAVVHSSGVVEVAYLEGLTNDQEVDQLLSHLQVDHLAKHSAQASYYELDYHQNRALGNAQLRALSDLATRHFKQV